MAQRINDYRRYLDLSLLLVRRELKVKYRGSLLGYLWTMINPLLFMAIISFVFSFIARGVPFYSLYVLSGILFWNLTANSLNIGALSIVNNSVLLRKIRFPAWLFPLIPVLTFSTNFLLALIPYSVIFIFRGPDHLPSLYYVLAVLPLFMIFLYGISLTLASLNVFFRDVGHVVEPLLVMVMYATPIIYDRKSPHVPDKVKTLLGLNPFTRFVESGRDAIFVTTENALRGLPLLLVLSLGSLAVGITVYRLVHKRIIFAI